MEVSVGNKWLFQRTPKDTYQKLQSLKTVNQEVKITATQKVMAHIKTIVSFWTSAPSVLEKRNNAMCRYYGHVLKGDHTKNKPGQFPGCSDCGKAIFCYTQLRRSTAN